MFVDGESGENFCKEIINILKQYAALTIQSQNRKKLLLYSPNLFMQLLLQTLFCILKLFTFFFLV